MQARTVRDLVAVLREARTRRGMTQAQLAGSVGVSREWVVRLEGGHPRVEAQLLLDALSAVRVTVTVEIDEGGSQADVEAFDELFDDLTDGGSHG
ncbi:helix-turn-helix domain-containing protein [Phytoactinopolyspora halotolerans]|uniref:Helix-turn-helix domain-containing protein n=1 Tax=Phytoactinopolyspora halotolerans TaxID=1981512 RepID=A0A6L9SDY7_9ACTN|nr:helix-turn-helix domain-containing protein [Phytoactinopolyspora halotolerans]NEE02711.1 helix-turn-helix domain-containing protein [Phytoactinopolyspora halotolerans]